jgi:hypothetical protein
MTNKTAVRNQRGKVNEIEESCSGVILESCLKNKKATKRNNVPFKKKSKNLLFLIVLYKAFQNNG